MTKTEFAALFPFAAMQPRLIAIIRKKWEASYTIAEEIASRTWCRAWEHQDNYNPESSPMTWLALLARSEAHSVKRNQRRSRTTLVDFDRSIPDPRSLPQVECVNWLSALLLTVPSHLHSTVDGICLGEAVPETAQRIGVSVRTVGRRRSELREFAESH